MPNLVALVTGANKGIGFEISRQLAQQQHTVLIGARDTQRGQEAAKQLRSEGLDARFVQLDVTDTSSIAATTRMIADNYAKLVAFSVATLTATASAHV